MSQQLGKRGSQREAIEKDRQAAVKLVEVKIQIAEDQKKKAEDAKIAAEEMNAQRSGELCEVLGSATAGVTALQEKGEAKSAGALATPTAIDTAYAEFEQDSAKAKEGTKHAWNSSSIKVARCGLRP
jgi:hypothetical protein